MKQKQISVIILGAVGLILLILGSNILGLPGKNIFNLTSVCFMIAGGVILSFLDKRALMKISAISFTLFYSIHFLSYITNNHTHSLAFLLLVLAQLIFILILFLAISKNTTIGKIISSISLLSIAAFVGFSLFEKSMAMGAAIVALIGVLAYVLLGKEENKAFAFLLAYVYLVVILK